MVAYSEAQIRDNTEVCTLPLVPELPLRLLRLTGPWCEHNCGAWADEPFPYWAFSWAAGQGLARYLLDHPDIVKGQRVLDFGAGCGLASIAAARCGASQVTAWETDPNAVTACRLNAELNQVTVAAVLSDAETSQLPDCDVLLASDVFFHWSGNNQLLTGSSGPAEILVAVPHKRGFAPDSEIPLQQLQLLAEYTARTVPEVERADIKQVAVYRCCRNPQV